MRPTPFTIACDIALGGTFSTLVRPAPLAEIVISQGAVPEWLDCEPGNRAFHVDGDTILMRFDNEHSFLIEGGERITHSNGPKTAEYITGPVFGALCYQRSMIPFHASAVVKDRKVHAFAGPQSAVKSSIPPSLAPEGWAFLTDDLLIVDPQIPQEMACYAVQRQTKPWSDPASHLAVTPQGEVDRREGQVRRSAAIGEASNEEAKPSGEKCDTLCSVLLVDARPEVSVGFEPIIGANAIRTLVKGLYLPHFATRIQSQAWLFRSLIALAQTIPVERLKCPVTWEWSPENSVQISEHLASLEISALLEESE